VTAAAALIVRPGRQWHRPNTIFLAVLSAQAWATTILPPLARSNAWWDIAHLTVSAAAAPVLYRAVILEADPRQSVVSRRAVIALTAAALTVTAGVAWELLEWRIDAATRLCLRSVGVGGSQRIVLDARHIRGSSRGCAQTPRPRRLRGGAGTGP
jgi:hypothetical protein